MRNSNLPQGFSPFSWAIALFCLPILLWPLAQLVSPHLLNNPHLSDIQVRVMFNFSLVLSIGISHPGTDFLSTTSTQTGFRTSRFSLKCGHILRRFRLYHRRWI